MFLLSHHRPFLHLLLTPTAPNALLNPIAMLHSVCDQELEVLLKKVMHLLQSKKHPC
jgi:hypothetical protein